MKDERTPRGSANKDDQKKKLGKIDIEDIIEGRTEKALKTFIKRRELTGIPAILVTILGVGASFYHLYAAYWHPFFALKHRTVHLLLMFTMIFLLYPFSKKGEPGKKVSTCGIIFILLTLAAGSYIFIYFENVIALRAGAYTATDVIFGIVMFVMVLEGTRRSTGWSVPALALCFFAYAFLGPYLPRLIAHKGYSLYRIIPYLYLTTGGIFGIPLGVSAKFILLFILFGAILQKTGAGRFFIKLALALAGRSRGGPAKAAVISSGFMGTISGSSVANTVTTGTFTIPLMKRLGFEPAFAGGVEAASSTNGQVMPPVMGAAAFLMAEYLGIAYIKVAISAAIPAILVFFAIFMQVDFKAGKLGLRGLPRSYLPGIGKTLKEGGYFLIPLFTLVYYLVRGYTPERAVFWTILLTAAITLVVGALKKELGLALRNLLQAFKLGGINSLEVAAACAAAGIIIGITTVTGLGLRLSGIVVDISHGQLFLAAPIAMVACLILGMGIPTTATYIILATLVAPALAKMGVPLLSAHLFIFFYGALADITPPVALAAYAGAGVAGSRTFPTGVNAFGIALASYVVPYLFLTRPYLLFQGPLPMIALYSVIVIIGIVSLAAAMQGYFITPTKLYQRLLLFVSVPLLFIFNYRTVIPGLAIMAFIYLIQISRK